MFKEKLDVILAQHYMWYISEGAEGEMADLRGADLTGADLRGADLCRANLMGANLTRANLRGADLCGADFSEAEFSGAYLCGADLRVVCFRLANLYCADFSGAYLCAADFSGAYLEAAILPKNIRIYQTEKYTANIHLNGTKIGCEFHENKKWRNFTDEEIAEMSSDALDWWNEHKENIFKKMDEINGNYIQ